MNPRPVLAIIIALCAAGCAVRNPDLSGTLASVSRLAAEPPEDVFNGPLTVDAAVQRAAAASDEIAALLAEVQVAARRKDAAFDIRDPELRFSYGMQEGDAARVQTQSDLLTYQAGGIAAPSTASSRGDITDERNSYGIGLRFFLPSPWVTSRRVSAEAAAIYAAVAELLDAQWQLSVQVRSLFAQVHFLDKDLAVIEELAGVYRSTLDLVKERLQQGQATVQDVMTASRRYLGVLSDRDEAQREYQAARRELASLAAAEADEMQLAVSEATFPQPDLAALDATALLSYALRRRADVSALFWRAREARARYEECRAARIPWPSFVQASYSVDDGTSDRSETGTELDPSRGRTRAFSQVTRDDSQDDEWRIDAAFELPFFAAFNSEDDVLEAEWRGADARERKARARVKREIADALAAARAMAGNRARYRSETAPIIEGMQSTLDGISDATGVDPADVARVREQILESRRMDIQAELEYQLALIGLESVLGMPLEALPVSRTRQPTP